MLRLVEISLTVCLAGGMLTGCVAPAPTVAPTATPIPPTAIPAPTLQPGDSERNVKVNDLERSYLLHIPPGLDSANPVPVVFAFHDIGGVPITMQLLTGFDDIANQAGFIVVYPEGFGESWNAGQCCGDAAAKNMDEPAFIREMLSDLGTIVAIDTKRIYAAGFANGAGFVYRLACEMSDTFAAVAPVTGALWSEPCQPEQPISIIHVHGRNDSKILYDGGGFIEDSPPIEQVIATWVQLNDCTSPAQVEKLLNDSLTHTAYSSCNSDTAVELYTLEIGGHAWPSKYVWDASQIIWDFFAAHPKP